MRAFMPRGFAMLRYLPARDLHLFPRLRDSMFRDRADQFSARLGWPVTVDAQGFETDAYDALNPLYVIWQGADGLHRGSMRFLPTTGPTMIADHFAHLLQGHVLASRKTWECTRFCLGAKAGGRVAAGLMLGGGEVMRGYGISRFAGVFDARMVRIYRQIGASPQELGSAGTGRDRIAVGLWAFSDAARARVARRAGIAPAVSDLWFRRSLGTRSTAGLAPDA
jgi:acyl homoserine lactone synthase